VTVPVQKGASAWTVGRAGSFAIAWSRSGEALLDSGDGYQDLTVFDFSGEELVAQELSVGYRPSRVVINDEETHAFIVSDPGISVVSLVGAIAVEREIFLPEETSGQPRDIVFSKDGRHAMVRRGGSDEILVVDTQTDERKTIQFPGSITDLDVSDDGSVAVAVVRSGESLGSGAGGGAGAPGVSELRSIVGLIDVSEVFSDQPSVEFLETEERVGSAVVALDGTAVLLFTNATRSDRLTILQTESKSFRVVDVRAPVQAAFLSDDATFAVTLMNSPTGSAKAGAFALVPVDRELPPRIEGTDTPPEFVSLSSDPGRALVTTRSSLSTRASTYFARFPELQVDKVPLPSRPLSSGIVPGAERAFVAQEHPEGRVTFVALDSGAEQTVTGFELTGKVVE